ncbi:Plug domain-containing protein [Muricauda sp. 2012CJ35-5]|uniref:Plug domain-containing protein n=1 Tax=Flagellimonas spongiicola TaxID=2942208 RepID=A0ABT0PQD8_9FLAO|nr:Plug domain-containing protein [Allomuricauda spongiicola]MCL6273614.1 Plug domain-containing protein [Allomuricauda spongiicola]
MRLLPALAICLLICFTWSGSAQDSKTSSFIKAVDTYFQNNPIEKVYLQLDKEIVAPGEDIWFSAYTVLGSNHFHSQKSAVLHIDLIDDKDELLKSQTIQLMNGRGQGSLNISHKLPPGTYQIRSYSNWMRNAPQEFFFKKNIYVLGGKDSNAVSSEVHKVDLQFFPEGGRLINGLRSKVAFKAIGSKGYDAIIDGVLEDSNGTIVANLATVSRGAGIFYLEPDGNTNYRAVLANGAVFDFPQISNAGYTLAVVKRGLDKIVVQVQATSLLLHKSFHLIGTSRGKRYFEGTFNFEMENQYTLEIPTEQLPSGVFTLTLLDDEWTPQCERITFVNNHEGLQISSYTNNSSFSEREEIVLDVVIKNVQGTPVETDFSIAVSDVNQVSKEESSANILTHLLLQSDLKGHIYQPAKLFKDRTRTTQYELDLVMLTHGWRNYNWDKMKAGFSEEPAYTFVAGESISGTAYGNSKQLLRNTEFNVIAQSQTNLAEYAFTTDNFGRFTFDGINVSGKAQFVFNAYNERGKLQFSRIKLNENPKELPSPVFDFIPSEREKRELNYLDMANLRSRANSITSLEGIINLDEVSVSADRVTKKEWTRPSNYGIEPDRVVYAKDFPNSVTLTDLINNIPGVNIYNITSPRNGPLWVVDGQPMPRIGSRDSIIGSNIPEVIGGVPRAIAHIAVQSVERVEFLDRRRNSTGIYGLNGSNGVFLIYTKIGPNPNRRPLSTATDMMLHSAGKEFYNPRYDTERGLKDVTDYRATLYWNPMLRTDEHGKATIRFFNSDIAKNLQINIEALSDNGQPGTYLSIIGANELQEH